MTTSNQTKTQITLPSDREIVVSRSFEAPRDLVWQMWTQAEHLKHWWGPKGWTLPVCEVDFRPGGTWFYCMAGPDGMQACGKATYGDIDAPNRFAMTDAFADTDGTVFDNMPQADVTVTFTEDNGVTTIVSASVYPTKEDRDRVIAMGMEPGIDQTLDRLEEYLETLA